MENTNYLLKVAQNRAELKRIGVRIPKYYFARKFPEYNVPDTNSPEYHRLDNLWYGKIEDDDFLNKMNVFVRCKQNEFEN